MFIQWIFVISSFAPIFGELIPERIVGGSQVDISAVPWQASLQFAGSHVCGAVIFSDQIVITAAHCFESIWEFFYNVRVGSSIRNFGGQVVGISKIRKHEGYYKLPNGILNNDIAVIRLEFSLYLGATISPISLADSSPAVGSAASVSGWGDFGFLQIGSDSLQEVTVDIVDSKECQQSYGYINNNMICAAAFGKDSCQGDSGGPLVSGGKLVGIVSFGTYCAHPIFPGVYANVAELKPWILNAIERL
uniref:trypsin n=1 Tax=Drosophila rhopaloa TaxID=1041015 RepID=A0A6P4EQB9_DRORH